MTLSQSRSRGQLFNGDVLSGAIGLCSQDRPRLPGAMRFITSLLSFLVITAVLYELRRVPLRHLILELPTSTAFWVVFAASYLAGPVSEWIIFRRLWKVGMPALRPLLRKLVFNELLLGYLGEAYFYTWARGRQKFAAAPFADVKDVAVLSAVAGNVVTLAILLIAWPMTKGSEIAADSRTLILSLSVVLITSLAAVVWRRQLFSLPRHELRFIFFVHVGRLLIGTFLSAVLWHLALEQVPLTSWLLLASIRLLISRLPLVPNKDVLFAGLTVVVLGHDAEIASLMTLMAGLILLTHLLVASGLTLFDLAESRR